jgi:hypothetical protein
MHFIVMVEKLAGNGSRLPLGSTTPPLSRRPHSYHEPLRTRFHFQWPKDRLKIHQSPLRHCQIVACVTFPCGQESRPLMDVKLILS